jgi:hypothetical protein
MSITLPTQKVQATSKSPRDIIIFSKPKVGKTELVALLDDCLIIDLESGTNYVNAMKVEAKTLQDIKDIGEEIKKNNYPYKYIAIDTITELESMVTPYAEQIYSNTPMGKNWFTSKDGGKAKYKSILNLPDGAGYQYLRLAFVDITKYIKTLAPRVIFLGHIKDTLLNKEGVDFTSSDLDLTGKIKRITTSNSDAIGYLRRKGNQNILSFKTSDEIACGARPEHLRNKEIVISEILNQGTPEEQLVAYWDKIYID